LGESDTGRLTRVEARELRSLRSRRLEQSRRLEVGMYIALFAVLFLAWLGGVLVFNVSSTLIHLLFVFAALSLIVHLFFERKTVY
jgi:uncharacterized membrane protein